jgi:hypothetical protein
LAHRAAKRLVGRTYPHGEIVELSLLLLRQGVGIGLL